MGRIGPLPAPTMSWPTNAWRAASGWLSHSTSTASQKRYGFRRGPETECFSPRASYLGTSLRPLSSSRTRALSLETELAQSAKHDQRPLVQERHHLLPVGRHLHGR